MKFDLDINESRISATSTSVVNTAEVKIHVSLPWALFGFTPPANQFTPATTQMPLVLCEPVAEEKANG